MKVSSWLASWARRKTWVSLLYIAAGLHGLHSNDFVIEYEW